MPAGQTDGCHSAPLRDCDAPASSDDDPAGSRRSSNPTLNIELLGLPPRLDAALIRRSLLAAIAEIECGGGGALGTRFSTVALRFLADDAMEQLHARHCGDPSTTDVLTFCHADPEAIGSDPVPRHAISVDLALGVDVARREAVERGHPVEHELILYAVHGLLHCVGHDDHDPTAFGAMHAEEDRILETIGLGAIFHDRRSGEPTR